ncbi:MAG: hypothetical protein SVS15_04130 [Thermodesulfobacteriota bacterium]|nr:hypothetical protein [Thermodesulfobacteriota bacterium]
MKLYEQIEFLLNLLPEQIQDTERADMFAVVEKLSKGLAKRYNGEWGVDFENLASTPVFFWAKDKEPEVVAQFNKALEIGMTRLFTAWIKRLEGLVLGQAEAVTEA